MRRKRLLIKRDKAQPERCFGTLLYRGGWVAETMEPGDADVRADGVPMRLPPGFYHCVPHGWDPGTSLRFKKTWALVGANVAAQKEPGVDRDAVLFHDGTRDEHTIGCVLVGSWRGESKGEPALLEKAQGEAMERLRDIVGHNDFYLIIMED